MSKLREAGEMLIGASVWGAMIYGAWNYCQPDPGYVRDPKSVLPWKHVWKPGIRAEKFPHVVAGAKENYWLADPGYDFLHRDGKDLRVAWKPNLGHPGFRNIHAGLAEGVWMADSGYRFASGDAQVAVPAKVVWTEGVSHGSLPHLLSMTKEGTWRPEHGYVFTSATADDFSVTWKPNRAHPATQLIRSDTVEGQWIANPGYRFADTNSHRSNRPAAVQWVAGVPHPNCPQAITSDEQDRWVAASGYRFVRDGALDVAQIETGGTRMASTESIIVNTVLAFAANAFANPASDDGIFASAGRFVAKTVRDRAAENAIRGFTERPTASGPATVACNYWGGIPVGQR